MGPRGNGKLPMNDAQRYRMNAADCLSAAERCGPAYRELTVSIAQTWLALARHQDAMDGLLAGWSEASTDPLADARSALPISSRPAHSSVFRFQSLFRIADASREARR
jgi:hypothetical protein